MTKAPAMPASTLRNRRQPTAKLRREESKDEEAKQEDAMVDPLTWFGAMVPRPICVAQKDFQQSLRLAVDMANLKRTLDRLHAEWDALQ